MGFNLGVHSDEVENDEACYYFIDRTFYNFVVSYDTFAEQSILKQAGVYYGIDLMPLTKIVYTWDEVTADYIKEHTQDTDFLLQLTKVFYDKIKADNTVCEKISYKAYEDLMDFPEEVKQAFISQMGAAMANEIFQQLEDDKKERIENPNPWHAYFKSGDVLEHLENLIKRIECYKSKGAAHIYFTAG